MSGFIAVDIRAEAKVTYTKRVNMSQEDYEKYLAICEEYPRDLDNRLMLIAIKYGFEADNSDIDDVTKPEEIEFTPVTDK